MRNRPLKILIIGVLPPPIGGVTVHVERLYKRLLSDHYEVDLINYRILKNAFTYLFKLFRQLLFHHYDIVHIHLSACGKFKYVSPFLFLLSFNSSIILTIHSGSFRLNPILSTYYKFIFKRVRAIIAVNKEICEILNSLNIPGFVSCIPAFIPPSIEFTNRLNKTNNCNKIVITSGYLTPLYNYEVLLQAIKKLKRNDIFFTFAFYNDININYKHKIENQINDLNNINVFFNLTPDEFNIILSESDAYIRTTITDGDSIALREAIEYNKIVLATNVVKRPEGCYLFGKNDSDILAGLLENLDNLIPPLQTKINYYNEIISVYTRSIKQV